MTEHENLAAVLVAEESENAQRQAVLDSIEEHPAEPGERGAAWLLWLTDPDRSFRPFDGFPPGLACPDAWRGEPRDLPASFYFGVPHYARPDSLPLSWQLTDEGKAAWALVRS